VTSATKTLPDHRSCLTHRNYKLGCEQYERLLARSGGQCEICGRAGSENPGGKLYIDHFGPRWAVRGLLCVSCNSRLSHNEPFPWCARYVADAWWMQECARVGVPAAIAPEPPIGSAVRDQWQALWVREPDGEWHPQGRWHPAIPHVSWQWLYDYRGPQNLVPFEFEFEI